MMTQPLGPLVISRANPRYFTVAGAPEEAVYLTGSHVNNNFHDGLGPGRDCPDEPERFDFNAYLELLTARGHNFIRLWRWEQFRGYLGPADVHFCMTPQPWPRTGPGSAKDGKPKFDLAAFDQAYFDRLRERVLAAGRAGIYASVMLFEGFSLHLTETPDNVEGHPFHAANNVNDIGITSIVDYQVLPLDAEVEAVQLTYIRKVIDTVHDLPNVLYEVANESSGQAADVVEMPVGPTIETPIGDSTQWTSWARAAGLPTHRPTTEAKSYSSTPTTSHRSPAAPCGCGRRFSAATTHSCTTWGFWVVAYHLTRRRGTRPSTHWSRRGKPWETLGGLPSG
jgi:hypothetical protein